MRKKPIVKSNRMSEGGLDYGRLAVVIVDMQPDCYTRYHKDTTAIKVLLKKQKSLLAWVGRLPVYVPVLFVEHGDYSETLPSLKDSVLKPRGAMCVRKRFNSLFRGKRGRFVLPECFKNFLKGRDTLLLTGVNSLVCITQTWRDAVYKGYIIVTANDMHIETSHPKRPSFMTTPKEFWQNACKEYAPSTVNYMKKRSRVFGSMRELLLAVRNENKSLSRKEDN